jgi:hypothetical protein
MKKNLLSMDQLNKVTKREQAVSTRFTELLTEIERLEAIDKATSERVAAEFEAMEFINSGGDPLEIEIPCSLELDMQMANESENIM